MSGFPKDTWIEDMAFLYWIVRGDVRKAAFLLGVTPDSARNWFSGRKRPVLKSRQRIARIVQMAKEGPLITRMKKPNFVDRKHTQYEAHMPRVIRNGINEL